MNLLSLFDISLETANKFYSWGWKASVTGAVITAIGVGLLMCGTRVRDHDFESNMSQLNTDAAKANERAAQLESDAAKAKEKTATLEIDVAKTRESVAQANERAAQANERAAQAERRAAEANLELAKFKAPRILSEAQKTTFTKSLEGAPRGRFFIKSKSGDDEARLFAIQIRDLLLNAGYTYKGPVSVLGWFQNDEPRKGIAIRVGSVEKQPPYSGALQRAFESIGIEPLIQLGAFEEDVVDVKIGSKP